MEPLGRVCPVNSRCGVFDRGGGDFLGLHCRLWGAGFGMKAEDRECRPDVVHGLGFWVWGFRFRV